jgi:membrane dipeptidase
VHSYDNALATSSGVPSTDRGLTDAGRAIAERVFAEGAIVDVSHASDRATDDLLKLAADKSGVVVASHSNA